LVIVMRACASTAFDGSCSTPAIVPVVSCGRESEGNRMQKIGSNNGESRMGPPRNCFIVAQPRHRAAPVRLAILAGQMRKQAFPALGILLATALGIAARPPEVFEYLVAPAGPGNHRNSEADILRIKGGKLLLAWIDFYADGRSDWSAARISAMIS